MIKCIIVEDQRPAQKILERYILDVPQLKLNGIFNNAIDATAFLKQNKVDLIFLDIHLPKLSGFDFLRIIENPPDIIVTSAFPDYAIEGFELSVKDYLLKPFDFSRFYMAVNKIIQPDQVHLTDTPEKKETSPDYYFARLDREWVKISFDDILYIRSSGDFVYLHFKAHKLFLSENLTFWEDLLKKKAFIRVHKSYLINISKIERVSGNETYMNDGARIPIGRSFRKEFFSRIRKQ